MDKAPAKHISLAVENMLKTGRLVTQTGLDLQQVWVVCDASAFECCTSITLVIAGCFLCCNEKWID